MEGQGHGPVFCTPFGFWVLSSLALLLLDDRKINFCGERKKT